MAAGVGDEGAEGGRELETAAEQVGGAVAFQERVETAEARECAVETKEERQ